MNTGIVQGFMGIRISVNEGSLFGRSMIRIIAFWGLSCGPLLWKPLYGGWYQFGGPHNKDYNILGSILGSPYFGQLLYVLVDEYIGQTYNIHF